MRVQVRYRYDAHHYDRNQSTCRPSCPACPRELPTYRTYGEAFLAQPEDERSREDGDQYGLELPERRFMIVVASMVD